MRIFLHQHVCSKNNSKNFEQPLQKVFKQAKKENCDLVVAPEVFLSGFDYQNLSLIVQQTQGQKKKISELCSLYGIGFYASFFSQQSCQNNSMNHLEKPFNQALLFNQKGKIVSCYNKNHLIKAFHENEFLSKGDTIALTSYEYGNSYPPKKQTSIASAICYDLRFPELFRSYAKQEAEIFLIAAQWPKARLSHMLALAKARAIENQAFVVLVNSVGRNGKVEMAGNSVVYDPLGNEVINLKEEKGNAVQLDFSILKKWRNEFSALYEYSRIPKEKHEK